MKDLEPMTNERKAIEAAQDALKASKKAMREFRGLMSDIMQLNTDEGRLEAANAAMGIRGDAQVILGSMDLMHERATNAMRENFPEFSDEVQTRGPGR